MHKIIVTDSGLETVAAAHSNGFLVSITEFAVSTTQAEIAHGDTELGGPVFYRAAIDECVRVSGSTVKFRCTIPRGLPADGSTVFIGSVALYTPDGTLFAHGRFDPVIEKMSAYDSGLWIYATCRRLGDIINLSSGISVSLSNAARVADLPAPNASEYNAVGVLDSIDNMDGHQSAGMALRYGPNGTAWSFSGYTRTYLGPVTPASYGFDLDANANGFWLNDREEVLINVVLGKNKGESRRCAYVGNMFSVLDKPLELGADSVLAIWRSNYQQLPTRDPSLSPYCVLGIGINDWLRTVKRRPQSSYTVGLSEGILPARQTHIKVPANLKDSDLDVWINGTYVDPSRWLYDETAGSLEVVAADADRPFFIDTFSASNEGGTLHCYEMTVEATNAQTRFQLPVISSSVCVLLNGKRVPATVKAHEALITNTVLAGDVVTCLCWVAYPMKSTAAIRQRVVSQCVDNRIAVDGDYDEVQTHLIVGDTYIPRDDYVRDETGITVLKPVKDATAIVTTAFDTDGFNLALTDTQSGNDTGPKWVDPASVEAVPCKVHFERFTYVADGETTVFKCAPIRNKNYALIHTGGLQYEPGLYEYSATANVIITKNRITRGTLIDIWCVCTEDSPDDMGEEIVFRESLYKVGQNAGKYSIPLGATEHNTLVWCDGAFVHNANITWNADFFRLVKAPANGLDLYVWSLATLPRKNYTTLVMRESQPQESNQLIYQYVNEYEKRGMLLYSSNAHQLPDTYGLENAHEVVVAKPTVGEPLATFYLRNLEPRTRLIKREEFDEFRKWVIEELKKYMPLYGPYVKWSNLTKQLIQKLACPIAKLNMIASGQLDELLNGSGKDKDSVDLANLLGLKPVRKSLVMDVLLTASYGSVGASTALGVPTKFNIYQYLEVYLRDQLGTDDFTIKKWEKGKKYIIDDIDVSKLTYEAKRRAELPKITKSTIMYVPMHIPIQSTTHPGMMIGMSMHDLAWGVGDGLPVDFGGSFDAMNALATVDLKRVEDATNITYTHTIKNGFDGKTYTVVWERPRYVDPATYETDYMKLTDGGGAPKYVQTFARVAANLNYNDYDTRVALFYRRVASRGYADQTLEVAWAPGGALWYVYDNPDYLKNASYTANIAFGATITNINEETGDALLTVSLTSGTVGYSQMPANSMMKKMQLPVEYTIYPGIIVNEDGSTDVVFSNDDLFDSCCWGEFDPKTTIDCDEEETPDPLPNPDPNPKPNPNANDAYVELSYIDPTYFETNLAASKG